MFKMGAISSIFSGIMVEDKNKKDSGKGMNWTRLEIGGKIGFTDEKAQRYKRFLRRNRVEVRKLPFEISEDIIFVRNKDLPRITELFKHKKLSEVM